MGNAGVSLDHVTITVKDLKKTIDFYTGVLGLKILGQKVVNHGLHKIVWLQAGSGMLEVFEFKPWTGKDQERGLPQSVSEQYIGIRHIGFTIGPKEFEAIVRKLRDTKVVFTIEPTKADWCDLKLVFFKDPDENIIEIISGSLENIDPFTLQR